MAAEIALHFEEGREYERAAEYLVLAGENATRRHAYRESIDVLEQARALLPRVRGTHAQELDLQILEKIGDAQYTLGDVRRSLETYDKLAEQAGEAGCEKAQAVALMRRAHPAAFVDPDRCVAGCERAAHIGAESGNRLLETHARLLASCWRIMIDGWRAQDAQACAAAMATLRELGGELPPYDQILYARVQVLQSDYAAACENADQALQKLTEAHGVWVRAKTLSTKATALLFWGRLGEAYRAVTEGIELAKRNENAPWLGILLSTLAWLRWEAFDYEGVRALANDVEQAGTFPPGLQVRLRAPTNVARKMILILKGFSEVAAGQYTGALRCFERLRDYPAHPKTALAWHRRLFARLGLAETWLASGNPVKAQAEASALLEDLSDCGDEYLKARAWEMNARLALARGESESAERSVLRALEAVSVAEIPLAAWRVHATASDLYRPTNASSADAHRSRAKSIIRELADSLEEVDTLRQTFLTAPPVRRILEDEGGRATPSDWQRREKPAPV
jgi:tetratricopeptide (TPR) repeat protein